MKHVTTVFFKGLFTLLPLLLSVYVFIWFLSSVERGARSFLLVFFPEFLYVPGMGVAIVFVLIYMVGTIVDRPLARWVLNGLETLFAEIPGIKTVYVAIKDFTDFLQPNRERKTNTVVLVKIPDQPIEMIGLLTRDSLRDLPDVVTKEDKVAVYFPMSYQFGGCTLFIPRSWVKPTNLTVEQAMRSIITAWIPGKDKTLENV